MKALAWIACRLCYFAGDALCRLSMNTPDRWWRLGSWFAGGYQACMGASLRISERYGLEFGEAPPAAGEGRTS